ncbi:MAG: 3-phosphoshikimate 1-carboxyvinyltransferase [Rikenellaceae bacterium]|jgi:3-phosphoshikimate 1-carboxyvinyltransferase|nr:3-phosphoshikimate 1-carboxyvinyltransferase [Rikenellaceae bacterium]
MDKTIDRSRVGGRLTPPSSKSYAQRAIAAALLSPGRTILRGLEMCDDTRSTLAVAQALGAQAEKFGPSAVVTAAAGCACDAEDYAITGGLHPRERILDIGESGLATRLFTPIASLCDQPITITGHGTIMRRPMDMMLAPLRALGVRIEDNDGYLPLTVCGPMRGGETDVGGSVSSQFLTGLLMALPLAAHDTVLRVSELRSIPYVNMTIDLARAFGVAIEHRDYEEFFVAGGQSYALDEYAVEGDWSGASCLLVAGAVAGSVTFENLNPLSIQADVAMIEALEDAGARIITTANTVTVERAELNAFEFDATHCPDLFPALVALAANCNGISEIRGTSRLQHKESDRAAVLQEEFGRMGVEVDLTQPDVMSVTGGPMHGAEVSSHGDHRIAMAAAVAALTASCPVTIHGAEAVAKSYPGFWDDLTMITK